MKMRNFDIDKITFLEGEIEATENHIGIIKKILKLYKESEDITVEKIALRLRVSEGFVKNIINNKNIKNTIQKMENEIKRYYMRIEEIKEKSAIYEEFINKNKSPKKKRGRK